MALMEGRGISCYRIPIAVFLVVLINMLIFIQPSLQQAAPVLMNNLHNITANVGGSAEFTCTINRRAWEIRWFLENTRNQATVFYPVSLVNEDRRQVTLPPSSMIGLHGEFYISSKYIGGTTYNFTLGITNIAQNDGIFSISCGYLNNVVDVHLSDEVYLIVLALTTVPMDSTTVPYLNTLVSENRNFELRTTPALDPTTDPTSSNNMLIIIIGAAIGGFMFINLIIAIICVVCCRRIKNNPRKDDKIELSTTGNSSGRNSSKTDKYQEYNVGNTAEIPQYAVLNKPKKDNSVPDHDNDAKPKQSGSQYEDVTNISHKNSLHDNSNDDEEAARISRDRELRRSKNVEGLNYAEVQIGSANGGASSDYVKPPDEFTTYAEVKIN